MSFLIARCGTFIPSRTVSLNAWTSRKAKRARTRSRLQHSPDTSMCRDLPLLPELKPKAPLLAKNARNGAPGGGAVPYGTRFHFSGLTQDFVPSASSGQALGYYLPPLRGWGLAPFTRRTSAQSFSLGGRGGWGGPGVPGSRTFCRRLWQGRLWRPPPLPWTRFAGCDQELALGRSSGEVLRCAVP